MAEQYPGFEEIERYLAGEMEPGEQNRFETAVNEDAGLKQRLEAYRLLQQEYTGMEQSKAGEEALTGTLASLNQKYFHKEQEAVKKQAPVRKLFFALAAAASLLAAFFLLKPVLFKSGSKDLFTDYYQEEQFPRQRGVQDSTTLAATFYDRKEYNRVLEILEPYLQQHPENTELLFFKGRAYLHTAQYEKANALFTTIMNGSFPQVFREKAQWLLSLVLLKQERKEECRKLLLQVPEKSYYYKKAQNLLGDL